MRAVDRTVTIDELPPLELQKGDKLITYDPVSDYRVYEGVRKDEIVTFKVKGNGLDEIKTKH